MSTATADKVPALPSKYEDALVASGLVHGVDEPARLRPVVRHLLEGEALCAPGDEADCLWVIVEGTLAARLGDQTLVARTAPAVMGEQGLIDDVGRRRAFVIAEHNFAEVLEIRKSAIEAHPQANRIWRNCAWILCRKLDEATNTTSAQRHDLARLHRLLRLYVGEHALSEEKLAPRSAVEGPRSDLAVIWFSDIAGFSKYSSSMSPYQAASFVQQFLTPQVEAIDKRRGYVDKFIGDAVMAYWIAASSNGKEECVYALDAALEVVSTLNRIALGTSKVRVRIGLHVGRVSIGNFGTRMRSQFTLIGPEVNKASRLESAGESQLLTGGPLGSLRASEEFFSRLDKKSKRHLPSRAVIEAKNIGPLNVYTSGIQDQ